MTRGPYDHPFDPLALWRDMLTKWQVAFSESASRSMAPVDLAGLMNQSMGMSVQLQQAMGMMMGKYLAALNMPTRDDLAAMDARLRAIEDRLDRLTQQVAKASEKPAAPAPRIDAEAPRGKRAQPQSRPEPAEAPAAVRVAAQAAHAARPTRRVAKKQGKAS